MRRSGSNGTGSSGNTNLILWQIIWKENRKKRRRHNGKHRLQTRNEARSPTNVRGHAGKSLPSVDATGKAREMDVPLAPERGALYGVRCAAGRDEPDGDHNSERRYVRTARHVSRDSTAGKTGVHL